MYERFVHSISDKVIVRYHISTAGSLHPHYSHHCSQGTCLPEDAGGRLQVTHAEVGVQVQHMRHTLCVQRNWNKTSWQPWVHPACKQLVRHGKGKCMVHMDDNWLAPQPQPIITYLTAHTHPALNTFHLSSLKAQRGSMISVTSPFGSRQTSLDYNGPAQTLRTLCISFLPPKNFVCGANDPKIEQPLSY